MLRPQVQHLALHHGQRLREPHHHEAPLFRVTKGHAHKGEHTRLFVVGAWLAQHRLFGTAIDQRGHLRERLLDQDALPPVKAEGLRGVRVH